MKTELFTPSDAFSSLSGREGGGRVWVSVIIPVYRVEAYIERCARSLMEQTLEEVEFIFVDDCSPDGSMGVLERVLKDYPERQGQDQILHHDPGVIPMEEPRTDHSGRDAGAEQGGRNHFLGSELEKRRLV